MGDIETVNFHNTIELTGHALTQAESKARSQQDFFMQYFKCYPDAWKTPFEIQKDVLPNAPITSVRRAMTNLTDAEKLRKTHVKIIEKHGALNHKWRLKNEKPEQRKLF